MTTLEQTEAYLKKLLEEIRSIYSNDLDSWMDIRSDLEFIHEFLSGRIEEEKNHEPDEEELAVMKADIEEDYNI